MDDKEVKFYSRLILAIAVTINVLMLTICAYSIVDRMAPIRSVQTVTVK